MLEAVVFVSRSCIFLPGTVPCAAMNSSCKWTECIFAVETGCRGRGLSFPRTDHQPTVVETRIYSRHEQDFGARKTRIWIQAVKWLRTVMEAAVHPPDPPSQPRHSVSPPLRGLAAEALLWLRDKIYTSPMINPGWCMSSKPSTFYRDLSCDCLSVRPQHLPHPASSLSNKGCFREHSSVNVLCANVHLSI